MGLFWMVSTSSNYFGWSRSPTRPEILLGPGESWEDLFQEGKGRGASRLGSPISSCLISVMTQCKAYPIKSRKLTLN